MAKKKPTPTEGPQGPAVTTRAPKKAPGTTPTQVRLTDDDKAVLEAIRVRYGLPSLSAAIRYSAQTAFRLIAEEPTGKKSRRTP